MLNDDIREELLFFYFYLMGETWKKKFPRNVPV